MAEVRAVLEGLLVRLKQEIMLQGSMNAPISAYQKSFYYYHYERRASNTMRSSQSSQVGLVAKPNQALTQLIHKLSQTSRTGARRNDAGLRM